MPAQKRRFPENSIIDVEEEGHEQGLAEVLPTSSSQSAAPPPQNGHHQDSKQEEDGLKQEEEEEGDDEDEEEEMETDQKQEVEEDEDEDEEEVKEEERNEDDDEEDDEEDEEKEDSEDSQSSSTEEEKTEFLLVELPAIRKDVQCPICLGIIKKTRTVMECLHRFCRECIDKSMRLGNNECPACRTHCASRRSLRDDPNYDSLIAALYPNIDKYEEEELAFHEEERNRNKQIQASIAQIFQRQSEALVRRRTIGKETTGSFMIRSQRNYRGIHSRRQPEFQGPEDNEEENDDNGVKDSSSADERSTEVRQRRRKRRRPSQPSSSAVNPEGGCTENDSEVSKENRGISPGLVWNTEMLAWGRGGTRSHTRHGNASSCNNKNSRNNRLSKLVEYLRSLEEKGDELNVHLMLISLEKQRAPSLQHPYLCCRPSLSVKHLCEYVAHQTPLQADEVEILLVKGQHNSDDNLSNLHPPISMDELQNLKGQETLAGLKANCTCTRDRLILAYRQKKMS